MTRKPITSPLPVSVLVLALVSLGLPLGVGLLAILGDGPVFGSALVAYAASFFLAPLLVAWGDPAGALEPVAAARLVSPSPRGMMLENEGPR